jgi:pseudouridine-5'-phosphate glycosidase
MPGVAAWPGYTRAMNEYLHVRPEVADALAAGRAVVALETTVIAHGLPYPGNLEAARRMAAAVRAAGAVPAAIGLIDGRVRVGLSEAEVERFARTRDAAKVSRRDLGPVLAGGGLGATTVAGTMVCAALAGIRVFATGGIGGVHRGGEASLDISADLMELARTPVAVVCAGAKSILDLARTLEVLETDGVPVVGYGTDELPAFYARRSGLRLEARVDSPAEAARLLRAHWGLGLRSGIVIANPPPDDAALDPAQAEAWIDRALAEARDQGVAGKDVTPFMLDRLGDLSGGKTGAANLALLEANARLAGEVAVAYAAEGRP